MGLNLYKWQYTKYLSHSSNYKAHNAVPCLVYINKNSWCESNKQSQDWLHQVKASRFLFCFSCGQEIYLFRNVHTGPDVQPALYIMGAGDPCPVLKRPERKDVYSLPTSPEVKN
jgi:hypothetical protein